MAPGDPLLSCWVGVSLPLRVRPLPGPYFLHHGQRPRSLPTGPTACSRSAHRGPRLSPVPRWQGEGHCDLLCKTPSASGSGALDLCFSPLIAQKPNQPGRFRNCSTNSHTLYTPPSSPKHTYVCTHSHTPQRTHTRNPADGVGPWQLTGPGQGWGSLRKEGAPFPFAQRPHPYPL